MKRFTAVLLAIMVAISACAAPAGNSGSDNSAGSEANGSGDASEGSTQEESAAELQLEIDEGFVSSEESGEA